jgi:hypothetical protein
MIPQRAATTLRLVCGVAAATLAAWLAASCGGRAAPAEPGYPASPAQQPAAGAPATDEPAAEYEPSSSYPDLDEIATVDDAVRAFDWAERDLGNMLVTLGVPAAQVPTGPYAQPPPPTPGEQRTTHYTSKRDRCQVACRALESMQRSAQRLCALTEDGDPRCETVELRVQRARELVHQVCPDCEAAEP